MKEGQEANVSQNGRQTPAAVEPAAEGASPVLPKIRLFLESVGISWEIATRILIGLCLLACVGLAAAAIGWNRSARAAKEQEASRLLLQATSSARISELLGKYGTLKIKPVALLRLAQFQQAEGNYVLAQDTYGQFLKEFPTHSLLSTAELGKTICIESAGNVDEAVRGYEEFLARRPDDLLAGEAIFGKARCFERLGRIDDARQTYENFLVDNTNSVWKSRAEQALEVVTKEIKRASEMNRATTASRPAGSEAVKQVQPAELDFRSFDINAQPSTVQSPASR